MLRHIQARAVDAGLSRALVQEVPKAANLEHANLLESPGSKLLGKLLVGGLALDTVEIDLGVKPLILKHLSRAEDRHTSGVAALEGSDERQLLTDGERILDGFSLILRVVDISGARGAQDGGQERAVVAQDVADGAGHGQNALSTEEVLDADLLPLATLNNENIMLLGGRGLVVVEVVDGQSVAVLGQVDVELEEHAGDLARDGRLAGQSQQDVSILVDEVDEQLGGEVGAEALGLGGEEHDMVVRAFTELEEGQRVVLGRLEGEGKSASCRSGRSAELGPRDCMMGVGGLYQ